MHRPPAAVIKLRPASTRSLYVPSKATPLTPYQSMSIEHWSITFTVVIPLTHVSSTPLPSTPTCNLSHFLMSISRIVAQQSSHMLTVLCD